MTPLLATLELANNFCISKTINNNATAIRDFKFELALKCPPTVAMLEAQLFSRQKFETKIDVQVSERINPLVLKVYQLEQQNQQYEHDIVSLEERIAKIEKQIEN
jgi:flagellar motility protein MotE (MotC chaperone)